MSLPNYQQLMLPVLKLAALSETRVPRAAEKIADELGLTAEQRDEILPSGKQRILHNRIHWAKFYMTKAGLIESPKRGIFRATQAGKDFLSRGISDLNVEVLQTIPAFADFYKSNVNAESKVELQSIDDATASQATPEEQIDGAQALLHSALRADLLQRILDNAPAFFERVTVPAS